MSDELTRVYQRLGRVEDKLDQVLEQLRGPRDLTYGGLGWTCPHCPHCANANARETCLACGRPRPSDLAPAGVSGGLGAWTCLACGSPNAVEKGNCGGCGTVRPGLG